MFLVLTSSGSDAGPDVVEFLTIKPVDRILVLPNAARPEYIFFVGGLLFIFGCKFFSKKKAADFRDNEASTNLTTMYLMKAGGVPRSFPTANHELSLPVAKYLEAVGGSLRFVFNICDVVEI